MWGCIILEFIFLNYFREDRLEIEKDENGIRDLINKTYQNRDNIKPNIMKIEVGVI